MGSGGLFQDLVDRGKDFDFEEPLGTFEPRNDTVLHFDLTYFLKNIILATALIIDCKRRVG